MNKWILEDARQRDIEYIVHFTNAKNLQSILSYGLLNRDYLDNKGYQYEYNDYLRLDNVTESISTSITFPNYKMFWPIRLDNPGEDWAILVIEAEKVLKLKCAFCSQNAASNQERLIELKNKSTYEAYLNMFKENHPFYTRDEMNLSPNMTTNPQAEVLVLENVPVQYIKFCFFENRSILNKYEHLFSAVNITPWFNNVYFRPRCDYQYW